MPAVGPVAEHEVEAARGPDAQDNQPLAYYNDRARRSELAKYTVDGLRTLLAGDPQAVLVARDGAGLIGSASAGTTRERSGSLCSAPIRGRVAGASAPRCGGARSGRSSVPARAQDLVRFQTDNVESGSVLERAGFRASPRSRTTGTGRTTTCGSVPG